MRFALLIGDPMRLSTRARVTLADGGAELCLSSISAFEIATKHSKGKLVLPLPAREWLREALAAYAIRDLPVTAEIAALSSEVTTPHADPCDRIIVATAKVYEIPIVTSDGLIAASPEVTVLW